MTQGDQKKARELLKNLDNKIRKSDATKISFYGGGSIIMIVFSFGLMIVSLFQPNWRHLIAVLFTLSGLVYYFPFVY